MGTPTILDRAEQWVQSTHLGPNTLERYASSIGLVVGSGIVTLEDLTAQAMARYLARRAAGGAEIATCNRNLTAVCSLVRWLVRRGELPHQLLFDLRDLHEEEPPSPPIDWLPPREYVELRLAAREVDQDLDLGVALVAGGGFRLGEMRHLRHEELLLEERLPFARVLRTYGRRVKRDRQRTTPIPRVLARELLERGFGRGRTGWVFPSRHKGRLQQRVLSAGSFQTWLAIAAARNVRDVNWVTLRHTFASRHVQANRSMPKVAYWLGNSVGVCERHYAALRPGGDSEAERSGFPDVSLDARAAPALDAGAA